MSSSFDPPRDPYIGYGRQGPANALEPTASNRFTQAHAAQIMQTRVVEMIEALETDFDHCADAGEFADLANYVLDVVNDNLPTTFRDAIEDDATGLTMIYVEVA